MAEAPEHQDGKAPPGTSPRIVFMGNPFLAVPSLRALHRAFGVMLAVTNPDRPSGRRRVPRPTPVKEEAERLGVRVFQPESVNHPRAVREISSLEPDFLVVVAFGEILKKDLLRLPSKAPLNAHASLLPRHRGPSPVASAILAGDETTGVSVMRIVRKMDAGPVYAKAEVRVRPDDTTASLEERLAPVAAELLVKTIGDILSGSASETPQQGEPTYSRMLGKRDGLVDWTAAAVVIERMTRAFFPWPTTYTFVPGKRGRKVLLRILRAGVVETFGSAPGTVADLGRERLVVGCGEGALELLEVHPEGKRPMSAAEFLRGHKIAPGTTLG